VVDPFAALNAELALLRPSPPDCAANLAPDGQPLEGYADRRRHAGETQLWPSGVSKGVAKVSYTHDAMIDLIIQDPCISQQQLAAHFNYTASWVSQIIASDSFQARLAERTQDLVDPTIRATVQDRFKAIVLRSLEILQAKLERPAHQIPDNLVLRSLETSSRALGYGAREAQPGPAVNVEFHLEGLADNLTKLLARKKAEILPPPLEGELG
jgi:DNA-binding MarR family transcriptional regulator